MKNQQHNETAADEPVCICNVSLCTSALDALLGVYLLRSEFELLRYSTALARMQDSMKDRTINIMV